MCDAALLLVTRSRCSRLERYPCFLFFARGVRTPPRPSLILYSSSLACFGRDAANMESLGAQHASLVEQAVLLVQVGCTLARASGEGAVFGHVHLVVGIYHDLLLYSRT